MIQVKDLWIPENFHGELQFPNGSDPEQLIKRAIRKFQVPPYEDIKYCIKFNQDGSRSLFFELVD